MAAARAADDRVGVEVGHQVGRRHLRRDGLVLTSGIGTPLDIEAAGRRLRKLLQDAGLPAIRCHDLRHSATSLLLAKGVAPRVVMDVLGHSQISVTLNTYTHVIPALVDEAAAAMDRALTEDNGTDETRAAPNEAPEGSLLEQSVDVRQVYLRPVSCPAECQMPTTCRRNGKTIGIDLPRASIGRPRVMNHRRRTPGWVRVDAEFRPIARRANEPHQLRGAFRRSLSLQRVLEQESDRGWGRGYRVHAVLHPGQALHARAYPFGKAAFVKLGRAATAGYGISGARHSISRRGG